MGSETKALDLAPTGESPPARGVAPTPAAGPKAPPDMASLMLELARIRRDVEGQSEPRKPAGMKTWLLAAACLAALAWSLFGGPCSPPGVP